MLRRPRPLPFRQPLTRKLQHLALPSSSTTLPGKASSVQVNTGTTGRHEPKGWHPVSVDHSSRPSLKKAHGASAVQVLTDLS
jgi:hypothetical protein